ncbi:MAG TPA: hypothetical protein VLK22_01405 [Candidatus Udaeobacter sp.]|nr:hypothetical protein [Candidatus Udaeobacter sp.]
MADKKIFPTMISETNPEIKAPLEELDLKLEKESFTEKESTEQKPTPEDLASPAAEKIQQLSRKPHKPRPAIPQVAKNAVMIKIEKIMEDGLNDSYQRLSPVAKQEFKIKGEEAAAQIGELLKSSHVKAKKILRLVLDWLRMLPGINHFFLEQEAKIKTDRIIALKDKI